MSDEEIRDGSVVSSEDEERDEQSLGANDSGSQSTHTGHAHGQSTEQGSPEGQSSQTDNAVLKELKRLTSSI